MYSLVLMAALMACPCLGTPDRACLFFCGHETNSGQYARPGYERLMPSRNSRIENLDNGYGYVPMENNPFASRRLMPQVQAEVEQRPQDLDGLLFFSSSSSSSSSSSDTNTNSASHGFMRYPMTGRASRQYAPVQRYSHVPCLNEYNEYVEPCVV